MRRTPHGSLVVVAMVLVAGAVVFWESMLVPTTTFASAAPQLVVHAQAGILTPGVVEAITYSVTNEGTASATLYSLGARRELGGTRLGQVLANCDAQHSGVFLYNHGSMMVQGKRESHVKILPGKTVRVIYARALRMDKTSPAACEGASFNLGSIIVSAD